MIGLLPWIRIVTAVAVYIVFALLASVISSKLNLNLREIKSRTSWAILLVGAIANMGILVIISLLLKYWDNRPLADLGLRFTTFDFLYIVLGVGIIVIAAIILIMLWRHSETLELQIEKPVKNRSELLNMLGGIGVLSIVAIQEEVLFRGYITLNLFHLSPIIVIVASTVLFTLIHLITNTRNAYQLLSWIIGGALLAYVYLITGSIWIPILLHFTIDLNNMLIFNIAGRFSFLKLSPSLTKNQLVIHKIVLSTLLLTVLITFYGSSFKLIP